MVTGYRTISSRRGCTVSSMVVEATGGGVQGAGPVAGKAARRWFTSRISVRRCLRARIVTSCPESCNRAAYRLPNAFPVD